MFNLCMCTIISTWLSSHTHSATYKVGDRSIEAVAENSEMTGSGSNSGSGSGSGCSYPGLDSGSCSCNDFTGFLKCHGDKTFYVAVGVVSILILIIIALFIAICCMARRYRRLGLGSCSPLSMSDISYLTAGRRNTRLITTQVNQWWHSSIAFESRSYTYARL